VSETLPANTQKNRHPPPVETRWKKGQSGNPNGRPKRQPIAEAYLQLLADPEEALKLARGILAKAQKGDVLAAKEIADRTEGKALQSIQVEGGLADVFAHAAAQLAEERRKR
jgi:hypothetical protein